MKVVWASTRRAVGAADSFAANTTARYLLSDVWKSVDAPLQEFSSAHIVALELPPVVQLGYEQCFEHRPENSRNRNSGSHGCPAKLETEVQ